MSLNLLSSSVKVSVVIWPADPPCGPTIRAVAWNGPLVPALPVAGSCKNTLLPLLLRQKNCVEGLRTVNSMGNMGMEPAVGPADSASMGHVADVPLLNVT